MEKPTTRPTGSAEQSSHSVAARFAIAALILLIAFLGYVLFWQLEQAHSQVVESQERITFATLRQERVLQADDVSYIESWMTFDYVAIAFRVPDSYIKSALNATDPLFPRVSIARYAKRNSLDQSAVLSTVRDAVQAYLTLNKKP